MLSIKQCLLLKFPLSGTMDIMGDLRCFPLNLVFLVILSTFPSRDIVHATAERQDHFSTYSPSDQPAVYTDTTSFSHLLHWTLSMTGQGQVV